LTSKGQGNWERKCVLTGLGCTWLLASWR